MRKVTNICSYYRGRLDIPSALEMTVTDLHILTYLMWLDMQTEEGQKKKESEVLEDALIHGEV